LRTRRSGFVFALYNKQARGFDRRQVKGRLGRSRSRWYRQGRRTKAFRELWRIGTSGEEVVEGVVRHGCFGCADGRRFLPSRNLVLTPRMFNGSSWRQIWCRPRRSGNWGGRWGRVDKQSRLPAHRGSGSSCRGSRAGQGVNKRSRGNWSGRRFLPLLMGFSCWPFPLLSW
jgi:hypothetical protein